MNPRVAVSLCLLGEEVRHDGGHKRGRFITDVLGRYFEWGAGVPRGRSHV
jgi:uncharacterized protein YbbK (DUF523 family)